MDIPGYGHVDGEWDLREGISDYLGHVPLRGKRVLEVGTANGFICFNMEREGAQVVAYDLSEEQDWDAVPYERHDAAAFLSERRNHIRRLNNAFWLCHRAFGSKSKMVYGDVYSVPEDIGLVDVCTFGSILLHLRDPFLAMQKALRLTKETVIVTDLHADHPETVSDAAATPASRNGTPFRSLAKRVARVTPGIRDVLVERDLLRQQRDDVLRSQLDGIRFLPDWRTSHPRETWWHLSPGIINQFLGVLGFERTEVTYHTQKHSGGTQRLFTVVGHRTAGPLA
jgi:hypothetical protein